MSDHLAALSTLKTLIKQSAPATDNGFIASRHHDVHAFMLNCSVCFQPVIYRAGLVVLLSGEKIARLEKTTLHFNASQALLLTATMPLECESKASPQTPIYGLYLKLNESVLAPLIALYQEQNRARSLRKTVHESTVSLTETSSSQPFGIMTLALTDQLANSIQRLITALLTPIETQLFVADIMKEIYWLLLHADAAALLQHYCDKDSDLSRIRASLVYIDQHLDQPIRGGFSQIQSHGGFDLSSCV